MNKVRYETEGVILNVQRYPLYNGSGIQTIPFFKGCLLSCKQRSSLESQRHSPELLFKKNDRIRCGKCINTCSQQALPTANAWFTNYDCCIQYGKCIEICPTRALEMKGERMSVTAVTCELEKGENLHRHSGGGITLSGDKPLAQPEFVRELLKVCKAKGRYAAIEASGFTIKVVIDEIFPYIDFALTDIKAIDPKIHERNIGMSNRVILKSLLHISFLTKVVVRILVIPGMSGNPQGIHNIAEFAHLMQNVDTIHLLPYHSLGKNKYNLLGRQYPMSDTKGIEEAQMTESKAIVESLGFNYCTGG